MRTKLLRFLVCMVLICALLVNISPIRTEAAFTEGLVLASGSSVIAAIGLGLVGVYFGDKLLYDITSYFQTQGVIDPDGNIQVYSFGDGIYGVAEGFITWFHQLLYDAGTLVNPSLELKGAMSANERFSIYGSSTEYYPNANVDYYRIFMSYEKNGKPCLAWGYLLYSSSSFRYSRVGGSSTGSSYNNNIKKYYAWVMTSYSYATAAEHSQVYSALTGRSYTDVSQFYQASTGGYLLPEVITYFDSGAAGALPGVGLEGQTLGYVAPYGTDFYEGYTEWGNNSREVTIDGEKVYIAPIGSTAVAGSAAPDYGQEDVWTGSAPIIIPFNPSGTGGEDPTEPDSSEPTNPLPLPGDAVSPSFLSGLFSNIGSRIDGIKTSINEIPSKFSEYFTPIRTAIEELPAKFSQWFETIIQGIQNLPQKFADLFNNVRSAVQAIPAAIADFFTITPDQLVLPASLTDFFPFCIPGDLYELVTVFDAEPEAPHFVFDVDFPYMEEPWHIDIDFAAWDPVALVMRRLELLLFIAGLAMATRNYYIRG